MSGVDHGPLAADAAALIAGGGGGYNSEDDEMDIDADAFHALGGRWDAYDPLASAKECALPALTVNSCYLRHAYSRQAMLKSAMEATELEGSTTVDTARKDLGFPVNGLDRPKGMIESVTLMKHQVVRASLSPVIPTDRSRADRRRLDAQARAVSLAGRHSQ
jgi:hypothetical protein